MTSFWHDLILVFFIWAAITITRQQLNRIESRPSEIRDQLPLASAAD
jgi:hypothetical protein